MEGVEQMEGYGDNTEKMENQAVGVEATGQTKLWSLANFSKLTAENYFSDPFVIDGYKWRLFLYPRGDVDPRISIFLGVADWNQLPSGWTRSAHFSLAICDQNDPTKSVRIADQHQFHAQEVTWGFSFLGLHELCDPSKNFLVDDKLVIEAKIDASKTVTYDSKKETGFVGLKNQGATCYLNSLLQFLYNVPHFRKAVYRMPTTENEAPSESLPLALQSLFYKMQYSDESVATTDLTKSFGWGSAESFIEHDVQELNRVLSEKLEEKMKGTEVEGSIQRLFEGRHMNYIECINVDYKSTRKESFYDLQLVVKGCKNVYESFDKYVDIEKLEGDNKYQADIHGLQDAKKGVLFIDFPPVLQLQLKRFEYDRTRNSDVKVNDRYEFPLQLDLDKDDGKYLSSDADRSIRNLYSLHSVLVHSAGIRGGHYFAFIRPTLTDQWYKFDDELVTKEETKRAIEDQYGGDEDLPAQNPAFNQAPSKFTKHSNAYMLVYIRETDKDKIVCNVGEEDIAEHLRIRLKKEQREKERKRNDKSDNLYTIIKIVRDEDLSNRIGHDMFFDLVDHDSVKMTYRIQQDVPFKKFKEDFAKNTGIPVNCQKFWLWARRQNHTYRPNRPLTEQEEMETVGKLKEASDKSHNDELKLWLEVNLTGQERIPTSAPERTKEDVLLFFKLYDPEKEVLRFVGRLILKANGKPTDILEKLNEMASFTANEEIRLYGENKFQPTVVCEDINKKWTFRDSQLENGDIVYYQKTRTKVEEEKFRYPDVPSFLDYLCNRQTVHFRRLEKPKDDEFCLELSKQHTYDDVIDRVAQKIGLEDPSKLRLTSYNGYSRQPKSRPIKYRGVESLSDMLVQDNQTSDILYFEMLDLPLPELQDLKTLKIAYHNAKSEEVSTHIIRLPKQSTIGDVINDLKTKVELLRPKAELRVLEVFNHTIHKVFPLHEKIENINDQYQTLRAEEIPDEEKELDAQDRVIHVYHFLRDPAPNQMVQNFGEPFFLAVRENETVGEIKVRVQNKLQVADDEFSKYKFAFLSLGRPEYLQDNDVASRFQVFLRSGAGGLGCIVAL